MIKKTITYTDYNDVERTEDFYFHLTKAELMEMELSITGGMVELVQRIVAAQDTPAIIKVFKDIIYKSYGRKTPDGRGFEKSDEILKEFTQTEAFSQLFMELATNDKMAAEFINGIMPGEVQKALPQQK